MPLAGLQDLDTIFIASASKGFAAGRKRKDSRTLTRPSFVEAAIRVSGAKYLKYSKPPTKTNDAPHRSVYFLTPCLCNQNWHRRILG